MCRGYHFEPDYAFNRLCEELEREPTNDEYVEFVDDENDKMAEVWV